MDFISLPTCKSSLFFSVPFQSGTFSTAEHGRYDLSWEAEPVLSREAAPVRKWNGGGRVAGGRSEDTPSPSDFSKTDAAASRGQTRLHSSSGTWLSRPSAVTDPQAQAEVALEPWPILLPSSFRGITVSPPHSPYFIALHEMPHDVADPHGAAASVGVGNT